MWYDYNNYCKIIGTLKKGRVIIGDDEVCIILLIIAVLMFCRSHYVGSQHFVGGFHFTI